VKRHRRQPAPKPDVLALDMQELRDIIERARKGPISEAEGEKLLVSLGSLFWMQRALQEKDVTLARLRSLFGLTTSEKTKDVLANGVDAKATASSSALSPTATAAVAAEPPKPIKGHGRNAAADYAGAQWIEVPYDSFTPGAACPNCPAHKRGKVYLLSEPRTLVRVVGQAPLKATVYAMQTWRCNLCGDVFTADPPPGIGDDKYDATAASMIALLKYGTGLPFHRLKQLQGNLGIPLPAATQWEIVHGAAEELAPVHQELIQQAAQGRLLHNDDTSMQVLDLRKAIDQLEKSGETDRTGIFSSGIVSVLQDGHRIALFITGRKHAGENIADLLRHRSLALAPPLQMCDGLDRNLPKEFATVLGNCLAHGRRKFIEVLASFPDQCRLVLETLREVYHHDAIARDRTLSHDERLRHHQEHSGPLMARLELWMHEQIDQKQIEPNSTLGGAIAYMQKRWDNLTLFLRQAGAPLDNNICERALKKAIRNRKNALFYKTENGARVGDLFMSLIHTAELAAVNPFDYLTVLLQNVARARADPAQWLPWNYRATLNQTAAPSPATA